MPPIWVVMRVPEQFRDLQQRWVDFLDTREGMDQQSTMSDKCIERHLGRFFLKMLLDSGDDADELRAVFYAITRFVFYEFSSEMSAIIAIATNSEPGDTEEDLDRKRSELFEMTEVFLTGSVRF